MITLAVALARSRRQRAVLEKRLSQRQSQEAEIKLSIDSLMDLLRKIIDTAQLSNCRPEVLARDLRTRLTLDGDRSLVKGCLLFANVRFNGLTDYLKRHYPLLNPEEILYCCCISLGIPSDNLRFLLQHENPNSLYNRTGRIRRKLGLTNQRTSVDEFLYQLTLQLEGERVSEDYFGIRKNKLPLLVK